MSMGDSMMSWSPAARMAQAFFVTCVVLIGSTGCTVTPLQATTTLKETEGVVIVRLVSNTQPTPEALERWMFLKVRSVGRGETVSLARRAYGNYSTAVFTGALPPGQYTLTDLEAVFGTWSFNASLKDSFPPFEIKSGEVTMLGTVVYHPHQDRRRYAIGLIDPSEEDRRRLALDFPDIAKQVAGKTPSGFLDGPQLSSRRQTGAMAKRASAALNSIYQAEPGDFYAGSRMGIVLVKRHGSSSWDAYDTRSTREMLAVIPYRGKLLAGGEEGLLVESADGGRSWSNLVSPDLSSTIIALQVGPGGSLFALCRREKELVLYRTHGLPGEWKAVTTFQEEQSLLNPVLRIQVLAADNTMYVVMPGVIYAVDLATNQAVRHQNPISSHHAGALPGGFMYSLGVTAMLSSLYLSDDAGKTFQDAKVSRFMRSPVFKDRLAGYAISARDPGIFPGELALAVTKDGGVTWKPSGKIPGSGGMIERELHIDKRDGSILYVGRNGTIFRTHDVGETWRQER